MPIPIHKLRRNPFLKPHIPKTLLMTAILTATTKLPIKLTPIDSIGYGKGSCTLLLADHISQNNNGLYQRAPKNQATIAATAAEK